jgi:hypothetical protein
MSLPEEDRAGAMSRLPRRGDRGSVTPFVLLLTVALAAVLGLVVEGGRVMSIREAAMTEAEQAARAGAAVLTAETLRSGGIATGRAAAGAEADLVMSQSGHSGTATATGDSVTASVNPFRVSTPLLSLVGLRHVTVSASATASAVSG